MNEKKYLILDMGYVLVAPKTGNWLVTPTLLKNVDVNKIDVKNASKVMSEFAYILDEKVETLEEEKSAMIRFYNEVFKKINYSISADKIEEIVNDFVFNLSDSKYYMYDDVKEELERLSKKYKILMLSDNWPCAFDYLKKHDIYKYFDKVYISSIYGKRKRDKVLFDYPIKEYDIKPGEAYFVDDKEKLLDIAVDKSLDVMLMDRSNSVKFSKYKVINSLSDID